MCSQPSLSQSSDYDPGNSTCLTPTKMISCQQTHVMENSTAFNALVVICMSGTL